MKIAVAFLATVEAFLSLMLLWITVDAYAYSIATGITVNVIVAAILAMVWTVVIEAWKWDRR